MKNIVLIGMPGCGKSTIGVVLAKVLGFDFVDADVLIQKKHGKLLRELIAEYGDDGFLQIENDVNKEIDLKNTVIATGGSVVYCDEAMQHYVKNDIVVYIELPYGVIASRLENVKRRGVVLKDGQTLKDLYEERVPLYEKYADIVVDQEGKDLEASLELLLEEYEVPERIDICMKETMMLVIQHLVKKEEGEKASFYLKTPTDILRYLWYEKTGQLQIIQPSVLLANARRLGYQMGIVGDTSFTYQERMKEHLKLKYSRKTCKMVAIWMNATVLPAKKAGEDMNPKRGMWVRFIRALRLAEYAKRKGFEHLAEIMDVFYNQEYTTWQGCVDKASKEMDAKKVLTLLKSRPGTFARCLFATMLRFGYTQTLEAFEEVVDQLPMRLLVSLGNAAEIYFDEDAIRSIQTITGLRKTINHNKLLALYSCEERQQMVDAVYAVYEHAMLKRFQTTETESKSIYIAPELFDIPINVGDRSSTIQDTSCALMGTRFPVEGDAVRLFLQWGKGLHAQHLDMDLSCRISYDDRIEECAYYNLTCTGAKHSGDIRSIPEMVGTAEYIELSLPELEKAGARYATFTCNAYSCGSLSPNLVVGWMNSVNEMTISEKDGVAYDPSCVQHMVRVGDENLSKGLVFGLMDIARREIIWLEMPFSGQTLRSACREDIEALLKRLQRKLKIGELLRLKAEAQGLEILDEENQADESYTYDWALNLAEVSKFLY